MTKVVADTPVYGRLKIGDIILEANGQRIKSTRDLVNSLAKRGKHIVLVVKRDRRRIYVAIPKP